MTLVARHLHYTANIVEFYNRITTILNNTMMTTYNCFTYHQIHSTKLSLAKKKSKVEAIQKQPPGAVTYISTFM